MMNDQELLIKYVNHFDWVEDPDPDENKVLVEACQTERKHLDEIYLKIGSSLPKLYEELLLSFRWHEVELEGYRLLANSVGTDFSGILGEIFKDNELYPICLKNGYVQFGFAPAYHYDPVCFQKIGENPDEWPIVRLDHEEILIRSRCRKQMDLASNFRDLVLKSIS